MTTTPSDALLKKMLARPARFACVGVSGNPVRPSHFVARYLSLRGFTVNVVNPGLKGQPLFGASAVDTLGELPAQPDIVDIFRRPEHVPEIVSEALTLFPALRCVWLQVGITSPSAEEMCNEAGVTIIQNRCPKIEFQRLYGELRQGGFATGQISSRRPPQN